MGKRNKNRVKPIDNSALAIERRKLEIKIRGLELTAERAAEDGDTEFYTKLCRQITAEQLKLDFLSRKKTMAVVDESRAAFQEY